MAPGSACRRCSGFARQSGGEVAVASEVGKGSIFTLYLPRTAGSGKSRQAPTADAPAIDGSGMSILVVEDNAEVGQFATDALSELGYVTTLVGNATHALEELEIDADRFDVVFTDVVMPGMTGIELAQEIHRRHPGLPVVLTSGYSHVLSEHGSYGFELLQKPYSIEQLSLVLHRAGRRKLKQAPTAASLLTIAPVTIASAATCPRIDGTEREPSDFLRVTGPWPKPMQSPNRPAKNPTRRSPASRKIRA